MEFTIDSTASRYVGSHAFLSASQYHWIRYDDDKILSTYKNMQAKEEGTRLHEFASEAIKLRQRLRGTQTLSLFVNDAIGFNMSSEVMLFYSENFYGTADAISFNEKQNMLRIHDLKTGVTPAHMEQLYIYAALFCLQYKYKPENIKIELRIYQSCNVITEEPDPSMINEIMEKGVRFDKLIRQLNKGDD